MTTETNHHARQLRAYLEAICSGDFAANRMPRWRDWWQPGRALVGASLAVTACGGEFSADNGSPGGNGSDPGGMAGQAAGGRSAAGIGTLYGMPMGGGPAGTGGASKGGSGVVAGAGPLYGISVGGSTVRPQGGTAGHPMGGNAVIAGMGTLYGVVYGLPTEG